MSDLFSSDTPDATKSYSAADIEVLEGLEPVRKRPGMYIGGTDEKALHHLVHEIVDNSMDEAVAGHASRIELHLHADHSVTVVDNGRGIPVDPHPKYPDKSALEVILCTLHSGGKFSGKAYQTSGGLHGVGISVVNALSDAMWVEVARDKQLYRQEFSRGKALGPVKNLGAVHNRRGTTVHFHPDPEIFTEGFKLKPSILFKTIRSKAYLYKGVEIRWTCAPELLEDGSPIPAEAVFHFPNGLLDFLSQEMDGIPLIVENAFHGSVDLPDGEGKVEYAIAWPERELNFLNTYCNTVPTPLGGTHVSGLRSALMKGIKTYAEYADLKKIGMVTADDIMAGAAVILSVFIREPQFQGQTKERLVSSNVQRLVDQAIKDRFDHWLTSDPQTSTTLVNSFILRAEERARAREDKSTTRKSATRKLRLPGKLSDCSKTEMAGTELFIVEGDSAGGSAKQARSRETQAVLPLRGKILNVVSATRDKIKANTEIQDLIQALGCGSNKDFDLSSLRYERIIIMTDADVDGAHIASLLITFFYTQMRGLIEEGHVYLAQPPLYRIAAAGKTEYAHDDAHKEELLNTVFKGKKAEISRFKGLGEMPAKQLKETTMSPESRTLLRITIPQAITALNMTVAAEDAEAEDLAHEDGATPTERRADVDALVERLMGKSAEARYTFIQDNAEFVRELDI
ncbi:MAG: DNA topoisomerase IV subunit B [Pseudobdellovibrionaceae bacterium]